MDCAGVITWTVFMWIPTVCLLETAMGWVVRVCDSDGMDCVCVTAVEWIVFVRWLWNELCLYDGYGLCLCDSLARPTR